MVVKRIPQATNYAAVREGSAVPLRLCLSRRNTKPRNPKIGTSESNQPACMKLPALHCTALHCTALHCTDEMAVLSKAATPQFPGAADRRIRQYSFRKKNDDRKCLISGQSKKRSPGTINSLTGTTGKENSKQNYQQW